MTVTSGTFRLTGGKLLAYEERDYMDGRHQVFAAIYEAETGFTVGVPLDMESAISRVEAMSPEEVLGARRWPAWFTVDQARAQLAHEARGCPPPFDGAQWDGHSYRASNPQGRRSRAA